MSSGRYDVVVLGGGPVGSYTAGSLATLGHRVLVVEEHPRAGECVCCTGIIGQECMQAFPVSRDVVLREASSATFFAPSGHGLRLAKNTTQAVIVDRAAYDRHWAGWAGESGSEYLWGSRAIGVELLRDGARITVTGHGESAIESKVVVIATGFGGSILQTLGLGRVGDFVMGAQAEVEAQGLEEVEVYLGSNVAPGFFAWVVPTRPGYALAGLLARRDTGAYLRGFLSRLAAANRISSPEAHIDYGAIPLMPLPRTYKPRLLVVGDAAGQVKPTSGGGIYYGFLCARRAVEAAHQALCSGDYSETAFAAYERDWQRKLNRELRIGRWARRSFETLSDRQIDRVFQIMEARHIHEALLNAEGFSFDWHGGLVLDMLKHLGLQGAMQMSHALISRRLLSLSLRD